MRLLAEARAGYPFRRGQEGEIEDWHVKINALPCGEAPRDREGGKKERARGGSAVQKDLFESFVGHLALYC
jgi:hypothetical protein